MLSFQLGSTAAAALLVVGLLTGCQSTGVDVPHGWQKLELCTSARPVAVEDLRKMGAPGCNMAGTSVEFPDGSTQKVGSVGANKGWSYEASPGEATIPLHFTMVNWGVPGIAVAEHSREGGIHTIWANSTKASDLLFELLEASGVQIDEPH